MSAFSANPFELLGEDDSGNGVATGKVVLPVKKEEKPAAKPVAAKPKEEVKPAPRKTGDNDNKDSRPPRRDDNRQPRPPRKDYAAEDAVAAGSPGQERAPRPQHHGERRERRGERQGENGAAPRGRVFDRRSGTGRGREEKRGGAGRGNWGSVNDEAAPAVEKAEAGAEEGAAEGDNAENGENTETVAAEPAPKRELTPEELERQKEREREEKLMTLDEYLKVKKGVDVALPAPRKAGEGEDQKKWAEYTAAKSDKDQEAVAKTQKEKVPEKKSAKAAIDPALLKFKSDAQRRARESRDDRPFRGDRAERGDRPDRPPREPRAAPQQQARKAPEPAFGQADFPALKA